MSGNAVVITALICVTTVAVADRIAAAVRAHATRPPQETKK